jgi:guanosine-3',5'-bis(diphosphate) 3'-pyrophosphohydrolase
VQVEDRVHLARLMRNIRGTPGVARILRERS